MEPVKLKENLLRQNFDVLPFIEKYTSLFVDLATNWEYSLVFISKLNKLLIQSDRLQFSTKDIEALRAISVAHLKYRESASPHADNKILKTIGVDRVGLLELEQMPLDNKMLLLISQVSQRIQKDDLNSISFLQQCGLDVNQKDRDGLSLLSIASQSGAEKCCFALLKNGANPHLTDSMGNTPLHWACAMDKSKPVNVLLYFGSNVHAVNHSGMTALMLALVKGNFAVVQKLIDYGADIDAKDWRGNTGLHKVLNTKNVEMAKFLIQCGASVDERNKEGVSPFMILNRNADLQDLLVWYKSYISK